MVVVETSTAELCRRRGERECASVVRGGATLAGDSGGSAGDVGSASVVAVGVDVAAGVEK